MHLNKQQSSLLHNLITVIEQKWGVNIGYTCPAGSFLDDENNYIIYDAEIPGSDPEECLWETQLLHKHDIDIIWSDIYSKSAPNRFPVYDEKTQAFWQRIQDALLSGELAFEPGINRSIDDANYSITKKADNSFDIQIKTAFCQNGFRCTAAELKIRRKKINNRVPQRIIEMKIPEHILKAIDADNRRELTAISLIEEEWGLNG